MLVRIVGIALAVCVLWGTTCLATPSASWWDRVFVHGYAGQLVDMSMGDFLWGHRNVTDMQPEYMLTLGGGIEKNIWGGFALGTEANGSWHWGTEETPFIELSWALTLRYYFPWSKCIVPSVSFGDGVSFLSIVPEYEKRFGTGDKKEIMDSQWLNFLFVEFEVLRLDSLSLFYRMHHRCTIFGTVGADLPGGVNFHSLGLRYTF